MNGEAGGVVPANRPTAPKRRQLCWIFQQIGPIKGPAGVMGKTERSANISLIITRLASLLDPSKRSEHSAAHELRRDYHGGQGSGALISHT